MILPDLSGGEDLASATVAPAPLAVVHILYSLVLTVGAVGYVIHRARADRSPARRALLAALAVVLPAVSGITSGVAIALGGAHLALAAISAVTLLMLAGMVRGVFELLPAARANIVNTIEDAVIVLDNDDLVVTANPPARALLAALAPGPTRLDGAPLPEVVTGLAPATGDRTRFDVSVEATGEHYEVRVAVLSGRGGRVLGRTLVARNVTAAREAQRALEQYNATLREQVETIEALRHDLAEQASRDVLTGLHNRRYLMEYLAGAGEDLTVAVIDIDHFKRVNDEWGHPAGDEVLRAVAAGLSAGLADDEVLARHGGEEFVFVFPGRSLADGVARIEALRSRVAATPVDVGAGGLIAVTFSAGVASSRGSAAPSLAGSAAADLLSAAGGALYEAKRNGRNQVRAAEPPLLVV